MLKGIRYYEDKIMLFIQSTTLILKLHYMYISYYKYIATNNLYRIDNFGL